jgi:hypothetical protein
MNTEERLERLERELTGARRRNRWALGAVGLAVVGLGLAWTWTKTTGTAQAQEAGADPHVIRAPTVMPRGQAQGPGADAHVIRAPTVTPPRAVANTIRANEFVLEDANGKTRARLTADKEGTGLILFDANGKPRAMLSVVNAGPGLSLYNEKGKATWSTP